MSQIKNTKQSLRGVISFTLLYLLIASIVCLKRQNQEFLFYVCNVLVFIAVIVRVHMKCQLSKTLLWCLSIWGMVHMAGGLMAVPHGWVSAHKSPVLYNVWLIREFLKFDHVVHAYGFGICTWVLWQSMRSIIAQKLKKHVDDVRPTVGLTVICVLGAQGLGAFNEILEFCATLMIAGTNVGGYMNTGWDLVANLYGSVFAGILILWKYGMFTNNRK